MESTLTIRPATEADIGAMTTITMMAYSLNPEWRYRFPRLNLYPEDHHAFLLRRQAGHIDNSIKGTHTVMVVEAPSNQNPSVKKVVALGVWELPGTFTRGGDAPQKVETAAIQNQDRDADTPRIQVFREKLGEAKEVFFNRIYGEKQLFLLSLATHPEYHRRGAGTMLCRWAMNKAREEGLAVTLFATGIGKMLYEKLGFEQLGVVHVEVDGEEEDLNIPAMVAST